MHIDNVIFLILSKIAYTKFSEVPIFWLIIPGTIGSLMSNESTAKILPGLFIPGQIINAICSLTYGAILLKLGSEEDRYRTAGICALIAGGVSAVVAMITGTGEEAAWTLLFTLPAAVVAMVGEYNEYMGHSAVEVTPKS